jgi:hypothetical protein
MASNEFWDQPYHCTLEELSPPSSIANFNLPYPQGYQGTQVCPMTDGTQYAIDNWGVFDRENLKWVMVPVLIGWYDLSHHTTLLAVAHMSLASHVMHHRYIIFNSVTFLSVRFYQHAPPGKPRMKEVLYSEDEEREMEEFNIKDHKGTVITLSKSERIHTQCS